MSPTVRSAWPATLLAWARQFTRRCRKHYREAAKHVGTFYGQLAATELNIKRLPVNRPNPSTLDRANLVNRELYRAIKRLESAGYSWRADAIYRHLARKLASPGEIAIIAAECGKARQIQSVTAGRQNRIWPWPGSRHSVMASRSHTQFGQDRRNRTGAGLRDRQTRKRF